MRSRNRPGSAWILEPVLVLTNIRFPRQASGAKVMAVLVGEGERDTGTALFGNAIPYSRLGAQNEPGTAYNPPRRP